MSSSSGSSSGNNQAGGTENSEEEKRKEPSLEFAFEYFSYVMTALTSSCLLFSRPGFGNAAFLPFYTNQII